MTSELEKLLRQTAGSSVRSGFPSIEAADRPHRCGSPGVTKYDASAGERSFMKLRSVVLVLTLLVAGLAPISAAAVTQAVPCVDAFQFSALRDQIPEIVGECTSDTIDVPSGGYLRVETNGLTIFVDSADVVQITSRGVLEHRRADGFAEFTDGATTWIAGPCGLQSRPRDFSFPWERGGACAGAAEPVVEQALDPLSRQWPSIEQDIFATINQQRFEAGLSQVVWDELASQAALAHAQDMARDGYLSHWDVNGKLPQQRYAEIGGRDYVAENVSCTHRTWMDPPSSSRRSLRATCRRRSSSSTRRCSARCRPMTATVRTF